LRVLRAPELHVERRSAGGRFEVAWTQTDAATAAYELQATADPAAGAAWRELYAGPALRETVFAPAGVTYLRVRARAGRNFSAWSVPLTIDRRAQEVAAGDPPPSGPRADLLATQRALLRVCAARGDALALLSLPAGTREEGARAHVRALREAPRPGDPPPAPGVAPLDASEARALAFGCVHHPWTVPAAEPRSAQPPDGAVAGLLAARARLTGAWTAAAGHPLTGSVGLSPALADSAADRLDGDRVNVLRATPYGFAALAQSTLSDDPDRRPVNVCRLVALVVRLARLHGTTFVFEPLGAPLRRTVERGFRARLARLHALGAFTGRMPDDAYRVTVPDAGEGRLVVELRVAPSRPLRFVLVRLVNEADRALRVEVS
jgi:hypothetical protein